MSKLPLFQENLHFSEKEWNVKAEYARLHYPLKSLASLPHMQGITPETSKHLKWKSLKWMILKDFEGHVRKGFFKHPLKYGWEFFKSAWRSKSYAREGDFFLYGVNSLFHFESLLTDPDTILVLGFSYCHKPFECPSGRFTDRCINSPESPVCQQCFIGKAMQAAPSFQTVFLIIPTIHYIGARIFEIVHSHPGQSILFMITACELTLEMFGDWGNMVNIRGLGIRLDGRICNTMKAFELSERGIKPGLTIVLKETQEIMVKLLSIRRSSKHLRFLSKVNDYVPD